MAAPRNRKQRRAAAAEASSEMPEIPLAYPPRQDPSTDSPDHKTLYEMIAARQNELVQQADTLNAKKNGRGRVDALGSSGTRFVTVDPSGQVVETDGDISSQLATTSEGQIPSLGKPFTPEASKNEAETDEPLPPFLDTVLLSIPLTTLHLTLAYLAAHQYAESTDVPRLIKEALTTTLPLLTFLIHFVHGHLVSFRLPARWAFLVPEPIYIFPLSQEKFTFSFLRKLIFPPSPRSIVFLPVALFLGLYLIKITNDHPYYAVMQKAPAYGTVWIWCVLEMPFGSALLGALGPLIWGVWWMGYGIV